MKIKSFRAQNFRNIESCNIEFSPGVNLLVGENAQGKTNAIEGIYIFARGKSFRRADEADLLNFGKEGFRIGIEYESRDKISSLEYAVFGRERRRLKNGYKVNKVSEMLGDFRAVLFSPDDLSLVKGGPEERREFLNIAISQCYPSYINDYSNYKKALENRNCILKNASKGLYYNEDELISWSYYMADYASSIYIKRRDYIKIIEEYARSVVKEISDGKEELHLFYKSDINSDLFYEKEDITSEYKRIFTENLEKEKIVGVSLYGPHREDVEISINEKNTRGFASQGQSRSVVLALKIAEGEVNKSICGEYPVFLFDDVLSELDEKRRKYLVDSMRGKQVIITSCENDGDLLEADKIIKVTGGIYE